MLSWGDFWDNLLWYYNLVFFSHESSGLFILSGWHALNLSSVCDSAQYCVKIECGISVEDAGSASFCTVCGLPMLVVGGGEECSVMVMVVTRQNVTVLISIFANEVEVRFFVRCIILYRYGGRNHPGPTQVYYEMAFLLTTR